MAKFRLKFLGSCFRHQGLVVLAIFIGFAMVLSFNLGVKPNLDHFNDVKPFKMEIYPTKSSLFRTKSLDEMRELMHRDGPRVHVNRDSVGLPASDFVNENNGVDEKEYLLNRREDEDHYEVNALINDPSNQSALPKLEGENIIIYFIYP